MKADWAVLSCGTVYYAIQGGTNFWVCVTIQLKATMSNENNEWTELYSVATDVML